MSADRLLVIDIHVFVSAPGTRIQLPNPYPNDYSGVAVVPAIPATI